MLYLFRVRWRTAIYRAAEAMTACGDDRRPLPDGSPGARLVLLLADALPEHPAPVAQLQIAAGKTWWR